MQDNVLTVTVTEESSLQTSRFYLYILTNNAGIVTSGGSLGNVTPGSDHRSGSVSYDISSPIGKGSTSTGLWYTDREGNRKALASRIEYTYTYKKGKLTATVKLYDPSSELTGLAFVGITADAGADYYSDVEGTHDISGYIRDMYNPEEETMPEEAESRKEKIIEEIAEVNDTGSGGKHRPPCVLEWLRKRLRLEK